MKIAVLGTGGVGGYFGGLLARGGEQVTFVARGEHYQKLATSGLEVRSVAAGDFHLSKVSVVESVQELVTPDVVLVSTKSYDLEQAGHQLAEVITEQTIIIPLQNGIDNDFTLAKVLPNARIYPGLVYIVSTRTAPGVIEQTAGPCTMTFGDRVQRSNPNLEALAERFRAAGVSAQASEEIEKALWTKFLFIITWGGMVALCRCPVGDIVSDERALDLYARCLDEGFAVARNQGVDLGRDVRDKILEKSKDYIHSGYNSKSSMLVDIEHHRRTEIEALHGTVVRLAHEGGIPVPIVETIYTAVRLASAHYLRM